MSGKLQQLASRYNVDTTVNKKEEKKEEKEQTKVSSTSSETKTSTGSSSLDKLATKYNVKTQNNTPTIAIDANLAEQERLEYLNIKEARDKKYALEQELDALKNKAKEEQKKAGTASVVSAALNPRKNAKTTVVSDSTIGEINALQAEINALQKDITLASRAQAKKYMTNSAVSADDFKDYSYDPVEKDETAEKGYRVYKAANQGRETNIIKGYMNDEEQAIYNYYYNKVGEEKAEEYFESIREDLNKRQAQKMYAGNENNTLAQLTIMATQQGLEQSKAGFQGALRMALLGDDSYQPTGTYDYIGQMAREDLADDGFKLPDWLGGSSLGQVAFDFVSTGANMAPSVAIGALTGTGSLAFGVAAAGNAYTKAINEGFSKDQATAYGVLTGISEATLEKVVGSVGFGGKTLVTKAFEKALPKIDNVFTRIAYNYGTKALSEGTEEALQEYLEPIYRNMVFYENNVAEINEEVLYAGLLGALSGVGMAGPSYAINEATAAIKDYKARKDGNVKIPTTETKVPENVAEAAKEGAVKGAETTPVTPSAEIKNETQVKAETAAKSTTEAPANTATSTGKMRVQTVTSKGIEEYASGFDGATENTGKQVAAMYDPQDGIDKETFVKGVEESYKYGRFNYDYNSLTKDSTFAKELPDIKRKQAYAMGQESARIENAKKAEEFKSRVLPGVKGKVVAENGVDLKKLPQHQRAVIKAVNRIISKATDVEFHIFSSYELKQDYTYTNAEGERVTLEAGTRVTKINGHIIPAQNAFYVPGTNQIWVDTNAGNEGQGIMEQAIAHELLHYLRDRGSGSYDTFKKITAELFERKGLSFSDAVATKLAEYTEAGIKLDEDGAQEEVIAQTVSGLLNDTKTFEALSKEIYAKDKTLWNEIKRFLSQVIAKIDAALKGTDIEASEARMLKEERDLYERAQKAFVEGVVEAGQNYKSLSKEANTEVNGEVKYQARNNKEETDSEGNVLSAQQAEYFKDSKVRDEDGNLKVMYHGTPNGDFTIFRPGTYFTQNSEYASVYQNPGASSLSVKKNVSNPKTYAVYLNIKKPFDTRNPKERKIFMDEYYRKWGTGAPLADSGLPDWTDGMDLQEFIEEMGYDYDGLILDEGATGGYGEEVKSRGLSYVIFFPNQVKDIDNKNPTDNPDIRYSLRTDGGKKKAVMSQQRIDYLIEDSGAGSRVDYAQAWITSISPTDFINLTTDKEQDREIFDKFGSEWDPNVNMGNYDYLAQLGKSVRQTPYLAVDINTGEVVGHDGRHRIRALEKEGIDSVEIKIEFRDEGYLVKYAPNMERWETKDNVKLINQFGTKQTATIHNVIPLNEDHRSEIEASYGEVSTKGTDIKYSTRNYKNALTNDEYGRARTAIINNHKGVLINNCAVRVIDYDNTDNSKIVCYNKLENDFEITDVYLIENYDYTVFSNYDDPAEIIAKGVKNGYSFSTIKSLLQDGEFDVGYVFRRYNIESDSFDEIGTYIETSKQTGRAKSLRERLLEEDREDLIAELDDDGIMYQARLSSSDQNRIEILENKIERLEKELKEIESKAVLAGQMSQGKAMAKDLRRKTEAYENAIAKKKEQISKIRQQKNELLEQARKKTAEAVAKVRQADREKMEKRLADVKAKEREKLSAVKDRSKEKQLEIANKYRESIKKATEGRHSTDIRHKIKRVVGELNTMLTRQTKEKHIPLELQKPVAAALDMLNMDDQRYYESRLKGLDERIANAKTSEEKHLLEEERNKILDHREAFKDKLASLKEAYAAIEKSSDPYISVGYNANIAAMINNVSEEIGDTLLRDMTKPQLEKVYDLYKAVLKTVRDANKLSAENKKATVIESGIEAIRELEKHKTIERVSEAKLNRLKFFWNNLKPVYAFRRMGSEVLEGMFKNIRKGEDTWATDVREAKDFSDRIKNRYNYKKWDFKKTYEFVSNTGKTFKLNLGQMMSLYAYSKRDQAYKHLTDGGFVFDDKATIKKNGREYHVNVASANNITVAELQKIVRTLSADQRFFVDEMQKYLSEVMGGKGNEVSRTLYDINLFKEGDSYFPLKSAKQFMAERNEVTNETKKLVNSGFTKPVQPGANNPIILSDFMDVWSNHVNDMSMYHAFTVPLEDFNKVYSFQVGRAEDTESVSVKSAMQNAFTKAANDYVEQLLKDINGGARTDPREGTYKKLIGNWKKAAVFASASVVIQQPSAIGRAFGEINPIYFIAPTEVGILKHRKQWEQVKKYAPIAFIKEMGYFDTDMGQSTTDYIKDEKTFKERLDNGMGWAPAMADELTWCAIWDAVKRETKAKRKDMTVNSEEFLKLAGERFTEVIVNTQVYDSVLSRSANMRSKGIFMNMLTAFMAEPTTTANMVEQAFREASRGHHKKAMGYIASVGTSVVLNSVLVSLVYAMKDDDEEERFHEKYLKALTQEIMDGFNPLTYIPLIKDIYSIFQGWKVERVDLSLVQDLYDATDKALKETLELFEGIESGDLSGAEIREALKGIGTDYVLPVVDVIGNMMGVPVKNIRRDIDAVFNTYDTITGQKDNPYSKARLDDILNDAVLDQLPFGNRFMESKDDRLLDGMKSGDKKYLERLKATYSTEDAYDNAVKAVIKNNFLDGEITEMQAKNYLMNYGGKDLEKAEEYLDSWKFEKKWGFQWSEREEAYANGQISASNLEKAIMEHKGKTAAEAEAERRSFDFKRAYPDTELTDDQIKNYYLPIKIKNTDKLLKSPYEQGISEKTYSEYVKLKSDCKGVDKDGDGKADSGTVKKEVMKVINKLDLTKEQKDALYYDNGWAKSTLWEAPWR